MLGNSRIASASRSMTREQSTGYDADHAEELLRARTLITRHRPRQCGAEVLQLRAHVQLPLQLRRAPQPAWRRARRNRRRSRSGVRGSSCSSPSLKTFLGVLPHRFQEAVPAFSGGRRHLRQRVNERRGRRADRARPTRRLRRRSTPIRLLRDCNPPANTDRRFSTSCSAGASRSYDQSIAARRVACRSTAPRSPPASRRKRWSSRCASCAGLKTGILAAASSNASGIPSSRRTTSATADAFSSVTLKSALTACARSTKTRTASLSATTSQFVGVGHAERWHGHDVLTRKSQAFAARREHDDSRARVRHGADQPGHGREQVLAVVEHQEQLFRTQEVHEGLDQFDPRPWRYDRTPRPRRPRRCRDPESGPARPTTCRARTEARPPRRPGTPVGVLPTPPMPVNVTMRVSRSNVAISATSRWRPTNEVCCTGRLPGCAPDDSSGGKTRVRPGATT